MSDSSLKIVILMAGYGTRLRPHTLSRPKQLLRMADRLVLDHLLHTFSTVPASLNPEYIFVIGYLGDQIRQYVHQAHPNLKVTYVEQADMRGQSHAISLTREYLHGPILVIYADTLIETDFSFLASTPSDAVTWVKAVPDPRRFGVANLGKDGWVTHLVEKPQVVENNLALVGCYYFPDPKLVLLAIDEQVERNLSLKNEFYLADAVNVMLEHGLKMRVQAVETWLDAGTIDDVLSTNRYYLEHGCNNTLLAIRRKNVVILPPVYIHPEAVVENAVIGPHVVIGAGCKVNNSILRDSIIDDGSVVTDAVLEHSLIGQQVRLQGKAGVLNLGDHSVLGL